MFTSDVLERLGGLLHAEISLAELERPAPAPVVDATPQSQPKSAGFKSSFKRIEPQQPGVDMNEHVDEELDGAAVEVLAGEAVDEGIDGEVLEDVDGESMEDIDGEPAG